MATHSSVLAWRIPGTEETGGLPSMGSHRVGHDGSDLAAAVNKSCPIDLLLSKSRKKKSTYNKIEFIKFSVSKINLYR